jgi:hypothetical protein
MMTRSPHTFSSSFNYSSGPGSQRKLTNASSSVSHLKSGPSPFSSPLKKSPEIAPHGRNGRSQRSWSDTLTSTPSSSPSHPGTQVRFEHAQLPPHCTTCVCKPPLSSPKTSIAKTISQCTGEEIRCLLVFAHTILWRLLGLSFTMFILIRRRGRGIWKLRVIRGISGKS